MQKRKLRAGYPLAGGSPIIALPTPIIRWVVRKTIDKIIFAEIVAAARAVTAAR
jgi:hypothetical protein